MLELIPQVIAISIFAFIFWILTVKLKGDEDASFFAVFVLIAILMVGCNMAGVNPIPAP
jgi:hypothetical protein